MPLSLDQARERLKSRLAEGEREERALLDKVANMVIKDRLVPPSLVQFGLRGNWELGLSYGPSWEKSEGTPLRIHKHALHQMAIKVGMSTAYMTMLRSGEKNIDESWKVDLLAHNLNELFHNTPFKERNEDTSRFLHRIVDNELRGFLSRRYNRNLASAPLLRSFVEACKGMGAQPVEATATPVRLSLKCLLPHVLEPFPGEVVAFGVEWANSDFGAGKMSVCLTVWRAGNATSMVLDEAIGKVHLGALIEDSDIEFSEGTVRAEIETYQRAVEDAVRAQLSPEALTRIVEGIRLASEEKIPWTRLRAKLGSLLSKKESEWLRDTFDNQNMSIIDLPPVSYEPSGERALNVYWAASAVAALASRIEDPERRLDLQREAGKLFGMVTPAA